MPNVVSAIDRTSHEIQIPSNEPQQKNILSANQFFSLIDMKRKFMNRNYKDMIHIKFDYKIILQCIFNFANVQM